MKRLITAIVLLVLIVAISCFSLYVLERDLGEIQSSVRELREADPHPELETKSEELFRLWNKKEQFLVVFLRHDILDEVTVLIAELPGLAQHEEYGLFYSRTDVILARLDDLLESSRPSYRNLL